MAGDNQVLPETQDAKRARRRLARQAKPQKRRVAEAKMDPVLLDSAQIVTHVTRAEFAQVHAEKTIGIVVHQSRRQKHVVFYDNFVTIVLDALKTGRFRHEENPHMYQYLNTINKMRKRDPTVHRERYCIYVKMDVSTGPTLQSVQRLVEVDICGAYLDTCNYPVYESNSELENWVRRTIDVLTGVRISCIQHDCYGTFCVYGNPRQTCHVCQTEQCNRCKAEWSAHEGMSCVTFKYKHEMAAMQDPQMMKMLYEGELQPCPSCAVLTEKNAGCNKMTCGRPCYKTWCWACGEHVPDYIGYGHYDACSIARSEMTKDVGPYGPIVLAVRARNLKLFGERIIPANYVPVTYDEWLARQTDERRAEIERDARMAREMQEQEHVEPADDENGWIDVEDLERIRVADAQARRDEVV